MLMDPVWGIMVLLEGRLVSRITALPTRPAVMVATPVEEVLMSATEALEETHCTLLAGFTSALRTDRVRLSTNRLKADR